jgi:hypothetical protein
MIFEGIFAIFLPVFKRKWYIITYMQTKAAELAGILEGKTIFYVKTETPNDRESIDEITLERQQGIYPTELREPDSLYRWGNDRRLCTPGNRRNPDQPDRNSLCYHNLGRKRRLADKMSLLNTPLPKPMIGDILKVR